MKKLSLIISVFNEEKVLKEFYQHFLSIKDSISWEYELIFVNDGSTDASLSILKALAAQTPSIKVLSLSRNFGHEAAMIAGIDHASGDGIVCLDADLQHPLECIAQIIGKLEEGYEVITMVRTENRSAGFMKNLTSGVFYKLINILSAQVHLRENASDFFALDRRAADVVRNHYREKIRFLRGYIQCIGFKSTSINYQASPRAAGESHYSFKKLVRLSVNALLCFSDFPLKLGIYAGLGSALIGFIVLIYSLFTISGAPSGYTTLITMICFMFSIQFIILGILGKYIAILFSEIKDRPIYIIEDTINLKDES